MGEAIVFRAIVQSLWQCGSGVLSGMGEVGTGGLTAVV